MFLDDQLLEMCKASEANTIELINKLNQDICGKCEDYYKSKITVFSNRNEIKTILDRTFNLFDSFVRKAKKSTDPKIAILGNFFEVYTFKKQLLDNEEMNRIYNSL